MATDAYLGSTIKFPIEVNAAGGVNMVIGMENIKQSVYEAVSSPQLTLLFNREYASRVDELQFEPNNAVLQSLLLVFIKNAVDVWEERVKFQSVEFEIDKEGDIPGVHCTVFFEVVATRIQDYVNYTFERSQL